MPMSACRRPAGAGRIDATARRPADVVDADAQHARGRARADPLRRRGVAAAALGQLPDAAERETGELGNALDADASGAQSGDVLADGTGVDVWVPAAIDPFTGRGAAGGGVGGGAVGAAATVLDVGSPGAVPVAALRMGALPRHPVCTPAQQPQDQGCRPRCRALRRRMRRAGPPGLSAPPREQTTATGRGSSPKHGRRCRRWWTPGPGSAPAPALPHATQDLIAGRPARPLDEVDDPGGTSWCRWAEGGVARRNSHNPRCRPPENRRTVACRRTAR